MRNRPRITTTNARIHQRAPFAYSCPYSWTVTFTSPRSKRSNEKPSTNATTNTRIHQRAPFAYSCPYSWTVTLTTPRSKRSNEKPSTNVTTNARIHQCAPFVYSCPYSWTVTLTSPRINFGSSASRSAARVRDCSPLETIFNHKG